MQPSDAKKQQTKTKETARIVGSSEREPGTQLETKGRGTAGAGLAFVFKTVGCRVSSWRDAKPN